MNIYKKLLEIKKKLPYLKKDREKGNGLLYSYVTPEAVLGSINPLLNEAGIFLKTEVLKCTTTRIFSKQKGIDVYLNKIPQGVIIDVHETLFDLDLKFTWVDTEDGERDECLFSASGVNGDEKGLGSALTYAERYFMLKTFNIPTGNDDPDAFQTKHQSAEEKKQMAEDAKAESEKHQQAIREDSERKMREINSYVAKLSNCANVEELKTLKSITESWILNAPEFKRAATKRFQEITLKDLQPA